MKTGSISPRLFLLVSLFALVGLGSTYLITKPEDDHEIWYFGHRRIVRWTSVETDPDWITISISNNDPGTYPTAFNRVIRRGIPKERGSFMVKDWVFEGLKEGTGYRINILTKDAGSILAQSPVFTISSVDPTDTVSISSDQPDSSEKHEEGHQKKPSKSDSGEEGHQKKPSKSDSGEEGHQKKPSKSDSGVEVVKSGYDKTASDQILVKTSRNDQSRTGCGTGTPPGLASVIPPGQA